LTAQQNLRIEALEKQRPQRAANSPLRRHHSSRSPPRQELAHQWRPARERIQPPSHKRGRTPPLREDRVSPTTKKGKRSLIQGETRSLLQSPCSRQS
jgi:hypothetical protein